MVDFDRYTLRDAGSLETPALVYYRDIIKENTRQTIAMAGGAQRLWPHVKSHKMANMIRMQLGMGITRFKCATIAEAQMVADCGGAHVLIAYPLVGPNVRRFLALQTAYPDTAFYAIGDDAVQLEMLAAAAREADADVKLLLDVNMGMNRTGIGLEEASALFVRCAAMEGVTPVGLHCYDGHVHDPQLDTRIQHAQGALERAHALRDALRGDGYACDLLVMGGTPTFPVHARYDDVYLSPGTVFLSDGKCMEDVKDIPITPAAGVWTRVISHPAPGLFTLDLGSKGISTDQLVRGILLGCEGSEAMFQSEEHWVYKMVEGKKPPAIGTPLFVIPMHICPTTALYPFAHVASEGRIVAQWPVTARNRKITI